MRETIEFHFKENIRQYLTLLVILILGIMIGTITVNNTEENSKLEICNYLNTFISDITDNKINYMEVLEKSVFKNFNVLFVLIFISLSAFGKIGIYSLIGYKGFTLGYTISSFVATLGIYKGTLISMAVLLFSTIVYIPAIFLLSIQSIKLYKTLREEDMAERKIAVIRYLFLIVLVSIMIIISSLIETFINSNLLLWLLKFNK